MRSLIFLLLISSAFDANAADPDYAVSSIPAGLTRNAHAIKRVADSRLEYESTHESVLYVIYAVTVLDEHGRNAGTFSESYDRFTKILFLEGAVYDAQGKLQRSLKERDVTDESYTGSSLLTDSRYKHHDFQYPVYPYTVEYHYAIRYSYSFIMPGWQPQDYEGLAVQSSHFTVMVPSDTMYRYRESALQSPSTTAIENGRQTRTWTVTNVPAKSRPFASPHWSELTPTVTLTPMRIAMEQYEGPNKTWADFGAFRSQLVHDRDVLPESVKQKVHALISGVTTDEEKIRRLYQFHQQTTRYISIQLGIGGWQPFEAKYVAEKGYGDCKALSNYMFSLLKEAGIRSVYAVIYAGTHDDDRFMLEDFPSNQFNHAILCVPMAKDTIWLECTSQIMPAGYMGSFTGNRKALLILPQGAQLVATPRYNQYDNLQQRHATGKLDADGNLSVDVHSSYRGEQQDDLYMRLKELNPTELKKYLSENLPLAAYDLVDFHYDFEPGRLPLLKEDLKLYLPRFASVTGKRLFIKPNLLNRAHGQLRDTTRLLSIRLGDAYTDLDTIEVDIPAGYDVEVLPRPVQLQTKFGNYSSSVQVSHNHLIYIRRREAWEGRYPATEWTAVKDFYNAIYVADQANVVLVKKTE
jgi:hypothetical protein